MYLHQNEKIYINITQNLIKSSSHLLFYSKYNTN